MAGVSDWWAEHQRRAEEAKRKYLDELRTLCGELFLKHKAEVIEVEYDGSGDDGSVTDVRVYSAGNEQIELSREVRNKLDEVVYHFLPGGWEINEGSFGVVEVDVLQGKITVRHNERVVTAEYSETVTEL